MVTTIDWDEVARNYGPKTRTKRRERKAKELGIRAQERERCAKLAETFDMDGALEKLPKGWAGCRRMIAAAIRRL